MPIEKEYKPVYRITSDYEKGIVAGSNSKLQADNAQRNSNDTERTTSALTYTKVKEVKLQSSLEACRIKFDLHSALLGNETAYAKIYKNGVAIGTERSVFDTDVYSTFSEDFTGFAKGDLIQIYAYTSNATMPAYVRNMRFYYSQYMVAVSGRTMSSSLLLLNDPTVQMTNQDLGVALEDFTTYTEVDAGGVLTVTANKITAVNCDRDIDARVYKDFGASHFTVLNVDFIIYFDSATLPSGTVHAPGFSENYADVPSWESTAISVACQRYESAPLIRLYLVRGGWAANDWAVIEEDTIYYCTLTRGAILTAVARLNIYTDSGRTVLYDTLQVGGLAAAAWRYCYAFTSYNDVMSGADWDGYIQNLDLHE